MNGAPLRCPTCNKDLSVFAYYGITKHLVRCATHRPVYVYRDNPPGRPRKHEPIRTPEDYMDIRNQPPGRAS